MNLNALDVSQLVQAFGECVYPLMFGGEKPGQDKFDKLKEVLGWLEKFVADDKVRVIQLALVIILPTDLMVI